MNNNRKYPPKILTFILKKITPFPGDESIVGDYEESYLSILKNSGKIKAILWYLFHIIKIIPSYFEQRIFWGASMLNNYIKTALRNILKNKVFSLINISGLAIGMACCIVIMFFVQDELSWDRFNENAERIFRITKSFDIQGRQVPYAITSPKLTENISEEIPEVQNSVRIVKHNGFVVRYGETKIITNPVYADQSIFEVFTFPLIRGNKEKVFADPNSVVISKDLAEKLFGGEDPMDKIVTIYSLSEKYDLRITGIMKDVPKNSHFRFDFAASLKHLDNRDKNKGLGYCNAYILLNDKSSFRTVEQKIPAVAVKQLGEKSASKFKYFLQPLTDIHLKSDMALEMGRNSDISYSFYYSGIAIVILLIASINFMNLSTARSVNRSREVGMRKVVGARKSQLIFQFIGEAVLMAFIALIFAVIIAYFLLPFFNHLVGRSLKFNFFENLFLYTGLFILAVFVGLLSGSYPAIFLSAFRPVQVIKGEKRRNSVIGAIMRKGLVVFQFAVSLVFIIGTIVVFSQLKFVSEKDLGFDGENVIEIPIYKDSNFCKKGDLIENEFSKHPNIKDVLVTLSPEPGRYNGYSVKCIPEGFDESSPVMMSSVRVGPCFFKFYKIDIVEGRAFSKEIKSDAESAVMINQTAAKVLGWDSPVGRTMKSDGYFENSTIIGVVKDYHQGSLHNKIEPLVYKFWTEDLQEILLRISPENKQETITFIEETWKKMPTHIPLQYYFLDELVTKNGYNNDRRSGKIFTFSAILAIILACLGLFGLALFTAEKRIKEIGIRKVMGASVSGILILLSKDFAKLVLFANIVAWPAAFYIMNKWLDNFAYKIGIGLWIFIASGLLVLSIALITIISQSLKAAASNPVDSLRYE